MNHADVINAAIERSRVGLEPTTCMGELREVGSYREKAFDCGEAAEKTGVRTERDSVVVVHRCPKCQWFVSVRDGTAVNQWRRQPLPSEVAATIRTLALLLVVDGPEALPEAPPPGVLSMKLVEREAALLMASHSLREIMELYTAATSKRPAAATNGERGHP